MANPTNLFNDFKNFNDDINYHKNLKNSNLLTRSYDSKKQAQESKNFQLFIDDAKKICDKLDYDTDFDKMVETFNTFYKNYLDGLPNDYLSLQNFTCMVSNILKNLENNFSDFYTSYGFDFKKLYEIYDPSVSFDQKLQNVKTAMSNDFLSRTIFHYENEVKYLSKGVNGGVNLITIKNGTNQFNIIEKYMLDTSDFFTSLMELLREYIIGTQLLYNVRPFTPNFTTVYGMYLSNAPIYYEFDDTAVTNYLKSQKKDKNFKAILQEYQNLGYYTLDKKQSILNITANTSEQKLYMMTEYSKGTSFDNFLIDVVKSNNVNKVFDVISIFAQIYRSLIFAYNKIGYVHNDLHCGNILVYEQVTDLYVPEIINVSGHNSQKLNYLAQIIDFGYSSINNYVNYAYFLFSDEKTNVHTDILRLYTSMLKILYKLYVSGYKNDTLMVILKFSTIYIGSYYFKKFKNYDFTTDSTIIFDILDEYDRSGLRSNFEYLSKSVKEKIIKAGLADGYDFYNYFIFKIQNSPANTYSKIGFSNVTDDMLYDFTKLEKTKLTIPVNDFNIESILDNIQPEGLTRLQLGIIKRSFIDFSSLCKELVTAFSKISDLEIKTSVVIYFCHNIVNFSRYLGLNTLLIYYTKYANIVPDSIDTIFNTDLKNVHNVVRQLRINLSSSTLPMSYITKHDDILSKFETFFEL